MYEIAKLVWESFIDSPMIGLDGIMTVISLSSSRDIPVFRPAASLHSDYRNVGLLANYNCFVLMTNIDQ